MGREVLNAKSGGVAYKRAVPGILAKSAVLAFAAVALVMTSHADAQRYRRRLPHHSERAPPVPVDPRDSIVAAAGAFHGRPYWLALAECGGIYFKLDQLYTSAAVRARVITPNPRANARYTKKLNEAIDVATTYFDAAESFLRIDRQLGRDDAILTYAPQSRAAGDRVSAIDAGLAAVEACPALYRACRAAHPKECDQRPGSLD